MTEAKRDFELLGRPGDTLFILRALTGQARDWVEDNVSKEGYQPGWPTVVYIEHRYITELLDGIATCGFIVDKEVE